MIDNLIDTHAHLDHVENLDEELSLARDAGVSAVMAVSMDAESCRKTLAISRQPSAVRIFVAMGMHPSEADPARLDECLALIRDHRTEIKAVGEVGLDFWYKNVRENAVQKERQKTVFRGFCLLARELHLPVVVHSRGAPEHCLEILAGTGVEKAVFHWYDASVKVLENILDRGYLISATPNLSYNEAARLAVDYAPSDRILMETDAPVRFCNRRTGEEFQAGPKDVRRTLSAYASLKGISEEKAAEIFHQNAVRFFGLDVSA